MFNATEEIAASANYPEIRVFTASLKDSTKPEIDLLGIDEMWSVAGPSELHANVQHVNKWTTLHEVCGVIMFGLQEELVK